jgi:uncharacterized iron-regulated membrane protein
LRPWIFQVHVWAGVGFGFYFAMMGLTGGMSVFLPELQRSFSGVAPVLANHSHRQGLQSLQTQVEQRFPGLRLQAVDLGAREDQPDVFGGTATDGVRREIYVDPYTAQVLADRKRESTFYDWVRDLHANLLSGETGKSLNGFGAVLLLITSISGLVVWWPGRKHVTVATFRISAQNGWRRLSYDIHRLSGVFVLIPLCVFALTGIHFAFPHSTERAIGFVLGPPTSKPSLHSNVSASTIRISLDDILVEAKTQLPLATPTRILLPSKKTDYFLIRMRLADDWQADGDNLIFIDAHTAGALQVQRGRTLTATSRLISGMKSVHYGQFGGTATRVLALLFGLSCPLLYATGAVIWWNRVLRNRFGASSKSQLVEPSSVSLTGVYTRERLF